LRQGLLARAIPNLPGEILAMLFLRCHAAFRAAADLTMSGQAVEAYVQCRATLELRKGL